MLTLAFLFVELRYIMTAEIGMSKRTILLVVIICLLGGLLIRRWQRPLSAPGPNDWGVSLPSPRPPHAGANGTLFVPIAGCATVTPKPDYRAYIGYSDLVGPDSTYIEGYKDLIGKIQTWRGVYRPRTIYAGEFTPIPPEKVTLVFESRTRCETSTP